VPGVSLLAADLGDGVVGGFTRRSGGASAAPYTSLNLGHHVGDDESAVRDNRALVAELVGVPVDRLCFMEQVHGADVVTIDGDDVVRRMAGGAEPLRADGMVTALPQVGLAVLVADCLPVLFADERAGVIGVAHAGRLGAAAGILQAVLGAMSSLGAELVNIRTVIGPAVCGRCYEVPDAMAAEVESSLPGSRATSAAGTAALDLPSGGARLLTGLGVRSVEVIGGCTREDPQSWFSYRRDGATGRQAGVVALW
jgi:hypothetical protein